MYISIGRIIYSPGCILIRILFSSLARRRRSESSLYVLILRLRAFGQKVRLSLSFSKCIYIVFLRMACVCERYIHTRAPWPPRKTQNEYLIDKRGTHKREDTLEIPTGVYYSPLCMPTVCAFLFFIFFK